MRLTYHEIVHGGIMPESMVKAPMRTSASRCHAQKAVHCTERASALRETRRRTRRSFDTNAKVLAIEKVPLANVHGKAPVEAMRAHHVGNGMRARGRTSRKQVSHATSNSLRAIVVPG